MPVADDLKVYLRAETAAAVRAMKKAQKQTDSLEGKTKAMVKTAVKSFGGYVAAAASIGAVVKLLKSSVDAYGEQVKAEDQLSAAIRATGGNVDELMPKYKNLASEIQGTTTVGDEATLALMQQARSMGVTDDRMEEVTKGAIGLSKALGMNTKQALRGVTNAFNGTYTTLQRYIPELRTTESESEKLAIVQQKMADGFEIAEAEANNAHGAMQQYKNAVGDLKEQLGETVANGIQPMVRGLTDFVQGMTDSIQTTREFKEFVQWLESEGDLSQMGYDDLHRQLANANQELERMQRAVEGLGFDTEEIADQKKLVEALEDEIAAKRELARWSDVQSKYTKEEAEREAAAAERRKSNLELLQQEYEKTDRYQEEALGALIRKFEGFSTQGPKTTAILERLRGELERFNEEAEETPEVISGMDADLALIDEGYLKQIHSVRDEFASMTQSNADRIEEQKQRYLDAGVARVDVERWASDQIKQIHRQELQEKVDMAMQYVSTAQDLFASIAQIMSNSYQARIDAAEGNEERQKELMREQAAAQKRWATFQALINTATAVTKTMTSVAYPANIPLAALQAAAGAAQVAAIQSQPIPAFAAGGDFTTSGPQMIMVGEKGRERVRIDPQPDSRTDGVIININGDMYGPGGAEAFAGYVVSAIKRGQRAGRVESL
jgi:hypothetical protein